MIHTPLQRSILITFSMILMLCSFSTKGQGILDKKISVQIVKQPLADALTTISKEGNFIFSYNSNIIKADSIVSINVQNYTVKQILQKLFNDTYAFKATGDYIIIQKESASQAWYVSGYVVDGLTGERIRDVSVYDKEQLVASLTNDQGYFKLKLKDRLPSATLNISKAWYSDTAIVVKPGYNQEITVSIKPENFPLQEIVVDANDKDFNIEDSWFGKMFLTSKQRIQSINLSKFFVDKAYQGSIVPGLSTHGKMSSQVVNKFSLNVIGGYTAGVDVAELAGIFNINKKSVKYIQAAGVFNIVGGNVKGGQLSGFYNGVGGKVTGAQASGFSNIVADTFVGVQTTGFYNHTGGSLTGLQAGGFVNTVEDKVTGAQFAGFVNIAADSVVGVQAAGFVNVAAKQVRGIQISGFTNVNGGKTRGMQLSGFVNYTKNLEGAQLGILNIADTASGVCIGVFNIVKKGYHKVSVSANEVLPVNVTIKSGTHWLYNIYMGGMSFGQNNKAYSYGYGYGSELPIIKPITLNPEITGQIIYLGDWDAANLLGRFNLNITAHIGKYISVFAGPSYNLYYDNQAIQRSGYKNDLPYSGYKTNKLDHNMTSWIGWNAGVSFF